MVKFSVGCVQMAVGSVKAANLSRAARLVRQAAASGANLVCLPEIFNGPYGTQFFREYAEPVPGGESCRLLSSLAKELRVVLIGGSISEVDPATKRIYNTCTVWGADGALLGTHRKVHLFDIDTPGMKFQESKVLSAGSALTHVKTPLGTLGVGICYDLRFPEMATIAARQHGCVAMFYPGAFNMVTGPLHWELLLRSRALDNQMYVFGAAPARDEASDYVAWGHSMAVDPFGRTIQTLDEKEGVLLADVDSDLLESLRAQIPVTRQRRPDVYTAPEQVKPPSA